MEFAAANSFFFSISFYQFFDGSIPCWSLVRRKYPLLLITWARD